MNLLNSEINLSSILCGFTIVLTHRIYNLIGLLEKIAFLNCMTNLLRFGISLSRILDSYFFSQFQVSNCKFLNLLFVKEFSSFERTSFIH